MTGSRIGPPFAASDSSLLIAPVTTGPVRCWPVTTTSAGAGLCGKAAWMASMVDTTGRSAGAPIAG